MSRKETILMLIFVWSYLAFRSVNSTVTCSTNGSFAYGIVETTNLTLIQETVPANIVSSNTGVQIAIQGGGTGVTLNISLPDNREINEIEPGAFKGTNNLNYLSLKNNKIHELKSCTFEGLENTTTIYLSNNRISSVHPYAFIGLNVATLDLSNNPNMQLTPITRMKELCYLNLSGINPENISAEIILKLPKLNTLIMENINFNCTCDTQWISILCGSPIWSNFGISLDLTGSTCIGEASRQASDSTLYTNCEYRSFQCFNKSIECVNENWTRVDTVDGCECIYSEELYTVSESNDINEYEDSSICQGNCTNVPNSYKSDCLEGSYNVNDILSSEIDECIVNNGNCSQLCTNNNGSYECSCRSGFQKIGFFDCSDINECSLNNGNCSQNCSNTVGSYDCSCLATVLRTISIIQTALIDINTTREFQHLISRETGAHV